MGGCVRILSVCTFECTKVCMNVSVDVCTYVCNACLHASLSVYVCHYVCANLCMYICMHAGMLWVCVMYAVSYIAWNVNIEFNVCMHTLSACLFVFMYACMHHHASPCMYVCMCLCARAWMEDGWMDDNG